MTKVLSGAGPLFLAAAYMATAPFCTLAQTPATNDKPIAFEVVSIRPSQPNPQGGGSAWGIQPDGYRTTEQTMWSTLMIAFFPEGMANWTPDRLQGAPAWVSTEQYDITAKVSAEDLPAWQKQGHDLMHQELFRDMLQSMLADRCKLVYHRIPAEVPALVLTVGKRGPQFKSASPDEAIPAGMRLADGGTEVHRNMENSFHFYGATMDDLASFMSLFAYPRLIVRNHTGLQGKYDFVLQKRDASSSPSEQDADSTEAWDVRPLGLEFQHTKVPTETIVIDSISRPSPN